MRLLAVLLAAALLPAQDPRQHLDEVLHRELEGQLAGDAMHTLTWAAHLCAEHRVKALVPELRAALRRIGADRAPARRFALVALLDALVQTDAKVPFEEVAPAVSDLTLEPALLLAARDPAGAEAFLLERFRADEEKGRLPHWTLCGNLLATQRSPAFGRHLFAGMRYTLDLLVVDQAPVRDEGRRGGGGGRSGGSIRVPADLPPTALYELSLLATPGAVVVAAGTTPVFARRTLSRSTSLPLGSYSYFLGGRMQARVQWLGAMLHEDLAAVHQNLERRDELRWSDAATLQADVARLRAAITADHERLRTLCVAAGWLPEEIAGTKLPLQVRLHDARGDTSTPLPTIE